MEGVAADPAVIDFLDGQRVDVVPAMAALALHDHKIGAFQHAQVLHHSTAVQILKVFADISGGSRLVPQQVEHFPSPVIGEGFEDGVLPVALLF